MKYTIMVTMVLSVLLLPLSVLGQRYKIDEIRTTYVREILYSFMDRPETQDDNQRANFFLNLPETELNKVTHSAGMKPEVKHVLIHFDAKTGDFRMDTTSAGGKESMIYQKTSRTFCSVDWTKLEYFCMSPEKMQAYHNDAQNQIKQRMPDLEKMIEGLPESSRKEALAALKQYKAGGGPPRGTMGLSGASSDPYQLSKTGKNRNQNGDVQEQIIFTKGDEKGVAWISQKYKALANDAQALMADMKKNFGNITDENVRMQSKDGYMMEIRTFEQNMIRGQAQLDIEKVTQINKGFSGNPFYFDKTKLTQKTPM